MIRTFSPRIDFTHPRHRPLTLEEERILCTKAKSGDRAARDKVVNANMRFVVGVARQFTGLGVPMEDLVSEGAAGLVKAVSMYDPSTPYRFVSYAVWWIRQAMTFSLQHQSTVIRTPERTQLNREMKVAEASGDLTRIEKLQAKANEINALRNLHSIDHLLEIGVEPVDAEESPMARAEQYDREKQVNRFLAGLEDVDKVILVKYFGLNSGIEESLESVGESLGITRERVRQRKEKSLRLIRHRFKDEIFV